MPLSPKIIRQRIENLFYYIMFQTFAKAVVPSAIRFAAPTGKKLKEKDLEFCRKHTRFDDKVRRWANEKDDRKCRRYMEVNLLNLLQFGFSILKIFFVYNISLFSVFFIFLGPTAVKSDNCTVIAIIFQYVAVKEFKKYTWEQYILKNILTEKRSVGIRVCLNLTDPFGRQFCYWKSGTVY